MTNLETLFKLQKDLVDKIKQDKPEFWGEEKFEGERLFMLCSFLIHEATELQAETKWKWWKAKENYNVDLPNRNVEIADMWHVLMQITMEAGLNASDIIHAYEKKWRENFERQEKRY